MKTSSNVILKVLGMLLLIAAVLKGLQLLTEPVANSDIWSYRPFLILTVELELALAIWLLSGLFKKAAWLGALVCFSFFSIITLYKAVTGAASCGCFGSVHVNPWITLFAIDLPGVIALAIFRPAFCTERSEGSPNLRRRDHCVLCGYLTSTAIARLIDQFARRRNECKLSIDRILVRHKKGTKSRKAKPIQTQINCLI